MKMFNVKKIVGAVVACGVVMGFAATPAHAGMELKVLDGFGINFDSLLQPSGPLTYSIVGVDNWNLVFTIGSAQAGSPPTPNLDLAFIGSATSTGKDLDVWFTQTDEVTTPVGFYGLTSNLGPLTTYTAWADNTNTPFGTGTQLFAPIVGGGSAYSSVFTASGLYSVTMKLHITQANTIGHVGYSDDAVLVANQVPEPASLMLLGTGLVAFGRTIRRRIRKA